MRPRGGTRTKSGFPHGGDAKYSPDTQRDFWAAYVADDTLPQVAAADGKTFVSYQVGFEAFDLIWKRDASGLAIEEHWGLFDNDRTPLPAAEVWR